MFALISDLSIFFFFFFPIFKLIDYHFLTQILRLVSRWYWGIKLKLEYYSYRANEYQVLLLPVSLLDILYVYVCVEELPLKVGHFSHYEL